jgi:AraC-like DNA-binding protein
MEVTTHWADAALLAEQFPQARVQPDKIFVRDGRLFTSAGVSAGIDLCLSLVSEDYGHDVAVRVAKRLVVYIQREGGQSQYSPFAAAGRDEDPIIKKVHQYVTEHIAESLSIEQLASAVSVSRRTFSRVFAKHANVTPSAFVEQVRVDTARRLLEETDAPLKTVAFQCGFHNATHMRMTFSRRLAVTPKQYRTRFRGDVPNDGAEFDDIDDDASIIDAGESAILDLALDSAAALNVASGSISDINPALEKAMSSLVHMTTRRAPSRKPVPRQEIDPYAPHAIFRERPVHQEFAYP